jgi:hypothetical protein
MWFGKVTFHLALTFGISSILATPSINDKTAPGMISL